MTMKRTGKMTEQEWQAAERGDSYDEDQEWMNAPLGAHRVHDKSNKQNHMTQIESLQDRMIELLMSQVVDLTMMSKIELGDDVIEEIRSITGEIDRAKHATPQDKASQLIERFYFSLPNNGSFTGNNNINDRWDEAVKCATITAEEVLANTSTSHDYEIEVTVPFWSQVLAELRSRPQYSRIRTTK
jgi:hypothetical protein